MAKENQEPIRSSVLDRLIDDQPATQQERPPSAMEVLQTVRESVQQNLRDLLNTRIRATSIPEELVHLPKSVANYGIADVSAAQLQSQQSRREFLRDIENRIRFFEPRLENVRVVQVENNDYLDRTLRFRINATLMAYPNPEPITFDSQFDPVEGEIRVEGGRR